MNVTHPLVYTVEQMLHVRMSMEVSTVAVILDTNSSLGIHNSRIPMKTLVKVRKFLSSCLPSYFSEPDIMGLAFLVQVPGGCEFELLAAQGEPVHL